VFFQIIGLNVRPSSCPGRDPKDHNTSTKTPPVSASSGTRVGLNRTRPSSCPGCVPKNPQHADQNKVPPVSSHSRTRSGLTQETEIMLDHHHGHVYNRSPLTAHRRRESQVAVQIFQDAATTKRCPGLDERPDHHRNFSRR
jgi:hypothetical protein